MTSATEGKRIEAKEADAAGVGVNWKAASGAQSPKAEIGWPRVGVTRKGSLEMRKAEESASGDVIQEIRRHMGRS